MSALKPSAVSRLHELKQIVELAAFACEARRIFREIELVASSSAAFGAMLSSHITAPREWTLYGDSSAAVLGDVAQQLGNLIEEAQP